jgi:hypothetical protein
MRHETLSPSYVTSQLNSRVKLDVDAAVTGEFAVFGRDDRGMRTLFVIFVLALIAHRVRNLFRSAPTSVNASHETKILPRNRDYCFLIWHDVE